VPLHVALRSPKRTRTDSLSDEPVGPGRAGGVAGAGEAGLPAGADPAPRAAAPRALGAARPADRASGLSGLAGRGALRGRASAGPRGGLRADHVRRGQGQDGAPDCPAHRLRPVQPGAADRVRAGGSSVRADRRGVPLPAAVAGVARTGVGAGARADAALAPRAARGRRSDLAGGGGVCPGPLPRTRGAAGPGVHRIHARGLPGSRPGHGGLRGGAAEGSRGCHGGRPGAEPSEAARRRGTGRAGLPADCRAAVRRTDGAASALAEVYPPRPVHAFPLRGAFGIFVLSHAPAGAVDRPAHVAQRYDAAAGMAGDVTPRRAPGSPRDRAAAR